MHDPNKLLIQTRKTLQESKMKEKRKNTDEDGPSWEIEAERREQEEKRLKQIQEDNLLKNSPFV